MFSRKIRSRVPILPDNLGSFKEHDKISQKETERKDRQERNYNKRHRVKKLKELAINDPVWIIDMRVYGNIVKVNAEPNSFTVKTVKGTVVRRNRWHLVPAPYR